MDDRILEQLVGLEEVFMDEEATPDDVEVFLDLWPSIKEMIYSIGNFDPDGTYHKPAITEVESLIEDSDLDSMYNLLSDVETTLCQPRYAEQHIRFCEELLELIDKDADSSFYEQYETGIAKGLVDLGRYDEAKEYYESLLKKALKANYLSNAIWAASDMEDGEWLKKIVGTYVTGKKLPEQNEEIQELARDMLAKFS